MHCKWTVWCSRVHKRSMAIEVLQVAGHHGTGLWCIPCPPQDAALVAQVKRKLFNTRELRPATNNEQKVCFFQDLRSNCTIHHAEGCAY